MALRIAIIILAILLVASAAFPVAAALPFFLQTSVDSWLSTDWSPASGRYGLLLGLAGSLILAVATLPVVLAAGWALAWQLTRETGRLYAVICRAAMQSINALPTVALGLFGLTQVVPLLRAVGGTGFSIAATAIVVALAVAPGSAVLIGEAFREFEEKYGALVNALDLGFIDVTLFFLKTSVRELAQVTCYIFCRIFGETTIVMMLSGNSLMMPEGPLDGFRTLTSAIVLEAPYASGVHEQALHGLAGLCVALLAVVLAVGVRHAAR